MNTTVAVALITALSTLFGAVATGCLALLTVRAQLRAQQQRAELDHREQHAKDVRNIRRDAYLNFMNLLTQVEDIFDREFWIRTGGQEDGRITPGEVMYTGTAAMRKLSACLDLIRLEGPSNVSQAAVKLYSELNDEVMQLMTLAAQAQKGMATQGTEWAKLWENAAQTRQKSKEEFIAVAGVALEGVMNGEA